MADLPAQIRTRLLELERKQARIDEALADLKRQAIGVGQELWQAEMDRRHPAGVVPVSNCVDAFHDICPCFPFTITLTDSYYTTTLGGPTIPLVWNGTNAWHGCAVWNRPGDASCAGAVTFALHYTLTGNNTSTSWDLTCQYATANFTTHCPVASTCATTTNQALSQTITIHCSGTSQVTFAINGTIPASQAWPAFRNVTLSFTLP